MMSPAILIRPMHPSDDGRIWTILEPVIRASETYALPGDLGREEALGYWMAEGHEVFVAECDSVVVGTYYLRSNHRGGGSHVANCGYATAADFRGRGVATTMCAHSLERARERGFRAMQFNFVVGTNVQAITLWARHGFEIVGRIPEGFAHPVAGLTDAYVMYRWL